jgi:hypothetical protein
MGSPGCLLLSGLMVGVIIALVIFILIFRILSIGIRFHLAAPEINHLKFSACPSGSLFIYCIEAVPARPRFNTYLMCSFKIKHSSFSSLISLG